MAGGSTAYGASSRRADKAAKLRRRARFVRSGRAEWEDYKPARPLGTRDDDDADAPHPRYKKNYYYRSLFVRSSVGTNLKRAVG